MSPINYTVTKRLKLTLLNQQATVTASVPVMVRQLKVLLSFDNLKCFDPGGMISLVFLPISFAFISVQFPSLSIIPPPEPPDRVVIPASSLNLSLLVTTAKKFSMLQTSLQLFDKMPQCHIAAWSAIINRCKNNEQVVAFDLFKDMHRMPTTPGDFVEYFEDKHMLCAARLLEMLNLYANHENCVESDPIKRFLIEEIKVLKEVKWIDLPNFMPQAAFLSLLQRKLQVSTQRACEKLMAKQKNSIQHVMEAVECGKTKVTGPLLDGLCIKVPKVLAPEPQLADTCSYCSYIFYDGSSSVFANIHCYFDDNAVVRIFDFVSKAGGSEIASLLFFMKVYTYPIDNSYELNMISHAIRNFTFECSGMTIDDAFRRLSLLLIVHFAAEIKVFVIVHVKGIKNFVHRRMRKPIGNVYSLIVNETFNKLTKKEWILFENSIILTFKLSNLLAMFRTYTYGANIVITQIYSMIKEVSITLDDWFKAYDEDKYCHCYGITAIIFGNMLGESWLKVPILYKEAFVERSKLVLQPIVTIREVVIPFFVGIKLINKCFTQVYQQEAQLCSVYIAKFTKSLESATCKFHMAFELQHVRIWS